MDAILEVVELELAVTRVRGPGMLVSAALGVTEVVPALRGPGACGAIAGTILEVAEHKLTLRGPGMAVSAVLEVMELEPASRKPGACGALAGMVLEMTELEPTSTGCSTVLMSNAVC